MAWSTRIFAASVIFVPSARWEGVVSTLEVGTSKLMDCSPRHDRQT